MVWFVLFWFYGQVTIVHYLMPNSVFTHIFNIWLVNTFCRYSQLNDQTVLFQTIQLSINHLFAYSLNVQQFYLTHRYYLIRCYHSEPEWTWEQWQWKGTQHSLKLQDWSLNIRLFNFISRTLVEGVLPLCRDAVSVFYSPRWLGF